MSSVTAICSTSAETEDESSSPPHSPDKDDEGIIAGGGDGTGSRNHGTGTGGLVESMGVSNAKSVSTESSRVHSSATTADAGTSSSAEGAGTAGEDSFVTTTTTTPASSSSSSSPSSSANASSGATANGGTITMVGGEKPKQSRSSSKTASTVIELPKSKLKLTGKALDKYNSMDSSQMQELALEYVDSIVLSYVDNGKRKIQNKEAFLFKRLRDFNVYHQRSTGTGTPPSSPTTAAAAAATSSSFAAARSSFSSSPNRKSCTTPTKNNGSDETATNHVQQIQQHDGELKPTTTHSQNAAVVVLPKSKMKIQGRALERYMAMPLDMRIKALDYCDMHMIQRRRRNGGGGGPGPGPTGSSNGGGGGGGGGIPPIKDEVAYMDKRLKDFASANGLPQYYPKREREPKQGVKDKANMNATPTKDRQLLLPTNQSATTIASSTPDGTTVPGDGDTADVQIEIKNLIQLIDGDEVVELPNSKVRIRDNILKRWYVLPPELQLRAIEYSDNIIMSRKDTADYIVNEHGFVATVIESFIKKWQQDEAKSLRRGAGGESPSKKKQQQQRVTSKQSTAPSSSSLSGPANKEAGVAVSSSSHSSSSSTGNSVAAPSSGQKESPPAPPIYLPRSKVKVTGNPLQIFQSLSDRPQLKQQTLEYCDDVFMKKSQDKKSRPIVNEMAYLSSVIDSFLSNEHQQTSSSASTATESNGGSAESNGPSPSKQPRNPNSKKHHEHNLISTTPAPSTATAARSTSATSTAEEAAAAAAAAANSTLVELPISQMKVIGHALQKLKSLPPPLQVRAILFCDQVLLRREHNSSRKKSRPIINETGYLAALIDNFLEAQCTKDDLAAISTFQEQQMQANGLTTITTPTTPTASSNAPSDRSLEYNDPLTAMFTSEDSSSHATLLETLQQDLEATKLKLKQKEKETLELSSKLKKAQSPANTKGNVSSDELSSVKAENERLQDLVKEYEESLSLKDDEIIKLAMEKTKLEEEAATMTETFSSMTKALVSTQEEKQEAMKFREESEARLKATELELGKSQDALKEAEGNMMVMRGLDGVPNHYRNDVNSSPNASSSSLNKQLLALQSKLAETESKLADEQWKVQQMKQTEKASADNRTPNREKPIEQSRFLDFVGTGGGRHQHQDISMFGTPTAGRIGGGADDDDQADITEDEIPFDFSKIFDDENPSSSVNAAMSSFGFQQHSPSSNLSPTALSYHHQGSVEVNGHHHQHAVTPTKGSHSTTH